MKKVPFLILSFLLFSCTVMKQMNNQEVKFKTDYAAIDFAGKMPLIDVEIDKVKTKFILDTGAGLTALIDSTIVPNFTNKEFGSFGSVKGADRKKTKNRFLTVSLHSGLFESENKVTAFVNMPKSECAKSNRKYTGILGNDVFFENGLSLHLDFSNNKVGNIDSNQMQSLLKDTEYYQIKSECKKSQIFVFVFIEGKEFKFKLDTGYSGTMILPESDEVRFLNQNKIELEGNIFQTISGQTSGKEIYYEKMPVKFGTESFETNLNVSNTIKAQNIGIEFIKGFDWIIDYNNNTVYMKRNGNKIESTLVKKTTFYAKISTDKKLLISVKEKSQTLFNLGDQIVAVNNQKVTLENICEMQDVLNKASDWSVLNIEVIRASP